MAKARELRRRIRSVQSTRQITRTMEMVSTSKLRRAQDRVVGARPYAAALAEVLGELYSPEYAERFPLLRQPEGGRVRRAALLLVTSNRGLCGAFNANLIRQARHRLEELEGAGAQVDLHLIGGMIAPGSSPCRASTRSGRSRRSRSSGRSSSRSPSW